MTDIYETLFGQKGNFVTNDEGRVIFMGGPGSGAGGGSDVGPVVKYTVSDHSLQYSSDLSVLYELWATLI